LDGAGLADLTTRLERLRERRELVEASDSPTRLDELDEVDAEERTIRDQLRRDTALNGRPRKLGGLRNRDRNSVCNAIRRALKRIDKYDKPLLAHLKRPILNLGHTLSYVPREDVRWTVSE
jgi:hypothetical protein